MRANYSLYMTWRDLSLPGRLKNTTINHDRLHRTRAEKHRHTSRVEKGPRNKERSSITAPHTARMSAAAVDEVVVVAVAVAVDHQQQPDDGDDPQGTLDPNSYTAHRLVSVPPHPIPPPSLSSLHSPSLPSRLVHSYMYLLYHIYLSSCSRDLYIHTDHPPLLGPCHP